MTRAFGDGTSNLERLAVWGKKHSTGWPRRSDEDVDHVGQAFIWSPKKFISQASAELQMPQMTPRNSSEEPMSKTIQITSSPETYSM
jgi:hypothetical protein